MGFVLAKSSIWRIVAIDVSSYILSTLIILTLKELPPQQVAPNAGALHPHLFETLSTILKMPLVKTSFLIVCFSQALFQGAYSALVSYLPIEHFKIGLGGVGNFQVAASIGITGGFLINWLWAKLFEEKSQSFPVRALLTSSLALVCLFMAITSGTLALSLVSFLGLNFCYECIWLHHSSEFFRASPKFAAARYQFTLSACAAFLMSSYTLAYSGAIEYLGLVTGTLTVLAAGIAMIGLISFATRTVSSVQVEEVTK